jgi:hypothetical protein
MLLSRFEFLFLMDLMVLQSQEWILSRLLPAPQENSSSRPIYAVLTVLHYQYLLQMVVLAQITTSWSRIERLRRARIAATDTPLHLERPLALDAKVTSIQRNQKRLFK